MLQNVQENMIPYHSEGLLLTDDKAPVELLGIQMIDQLIDEELQYFKGIYQREGLPGLLDTLLA